MIIFIQVVFGVPLLSFTGLRVSLSAFLNCWCFFGESAQVPEPQQASMVYFFAPWILFGDLVGLQLFAGINVARMENAWDPPELASVIAVFGFLCC